MKRIMAFVLAMVMVMPLVGCGPETEQERLERSIEEHRRLLEEQNQAARDAIQNVEDLQNDWAEYERLRDALGG